MARINPNIANGTCYSTDNTKTKGTFVPCGNDLIQAWPCCQLGSVCLSLGDANACWDPKSLNTYVAGCTDPSFVSPNCLRKPPTFRNQEWVGLNQACTELNANRGPGGVKWTGCKVDDNSTELVKVPMANCTPYCSESDVMFVGSSSLAAYASLPTISGSSIFWVGDYTPPPTPAPGYTPGTTTGVIPTSKPMNPPSSSGDKDAGGLSTGAKAGIGVGAAVGGLILLALIAGLVVSCLRRRRQHKQQHQQGNNTGYGNHGFNHQSQDVSMYAPSSGGYPSPPMPYSSTFPHHNMGAPAGYDSPRNHLAAHNSYKSELPAEEPSPTYKPPLSPP
ncbi:hypothetical protein QBC35DRAFT_457444 [Podospora australis]|uniref:Uncharacterized protein n=1 Tax=Podospora australis TaxID=1536484 RepID=A0AAN7ADX5_9PEZI|nr:hypothetical protein QBC35DRAFT_457444 [Podospora australis]